MMSQEAMSNVVKLYEERKISQLQTAENLMFNFITAKNPRQMKSANNKYDKIHNKYKINSK